MKTNRNSWDGLWEVEGRDGGLKRLGTLRSVTGNGASCLTCCCCAHLLSRSGWNIQPLVYSVPFSGSGEAGQANQQPTLGSRWAQLQAVHVQKGIRVHCSPSQVPARGCRVFPGSFPWVSLWPSPAASMEMFASSIPACLSL